MTPPNDSPYVGPKPFELGQELFGRDAETKELRNLILGRRLVLLYSPSGAGKTSLINAKLIGTLGASGVRVLPVIRITGPPPYMASVLQKLEPDRKAGGGSFTEYLDQRNDLQGKRSLLIFDQFEEILVHDPTDHSGREAFFQELGDALSNTTRFALSCGSIIHVRADPQRATGNSGNSLCRSPRG
jgi:hypothetical protein